MTPDDYRFKLQGSNQVSHNLRLRFVAVIMVDGFGGQAKARQIQRNYVVVFFEIGRYAPERLLRIRKAMDKYE